MRFSINQKSLFILILLFFTTTGIAQNQDRINEIMEIIKQQDSISRTIFLDSSDLPGMRLSFNSNCRRVWNDIDDSIKSVQQFYDIRMKFNSNKEALAFHKKYLAENSENGPKIKKHKIKVSGVDNLLVYTQSPLMSNMFLKPYGFQAYNFIYVVDSYFVKMYTTCILEYKPSYFKPMIESARDSINSESEDSNK